MSQATMKVQPKTKDQQTGAHAALTARRIVAYAVLILLCALCLFFFYVLIINATRPHADIQKGFSFLPGSWTSLCNNFTQVINNANIPIISGMRNSLIVSAMTAIFACYFSALTAFGIHAYRFKGRALALTFILLIMTMPTQVSALGFVQLMGKMNLKDSLPCRCSCRLSPAPRCSTSCTSTCRRACRWRSSKPPASTAAASSARSTASFCR